MILTIRDYIVMKKVITLFVLFALMSANVEVNAQALTQTYDRLGLTCRFPAGFQAIGEVEDGMAMHLFADNTERPKNAMVVVEIKHELAQQVIEEEGIDYEALLDTLVEVLEGNKNEELERELQNELDIENIDLDELDMTSWHLDRLNLNAVNLHGLNLIGICGELLNIVFDWCVNAIYNVLYDIVYYAIDWEILPEIAAEEGVGLKVNHLSDNSIDAMVWDDYIMLNLKLYRAYNDYIALSATGVIEGDYIEGSAILYKLSDNNLGLSTKLTVNQEEYNAMANLTKLDNRTFGLTVDVKDLAELIEEEELAGIQYAKGILSLQDNRIVAMGWMSESYTMQHAFETMYSTIQFNDLVHYQPTTEDYWY